MLKVFLVDDEPFILQGLRAMIDWESEGYRIVGTAENGQEALTFLREQEVDLIIADIRMPVMDGLTLFETLCKEYPSNAHFAILSGMDDFTYAQRAIRLQCAEYILKPVQKDALLSFLRNISHQAAQKQQENEVNDQMEKAFYARSVVALLMGQYDASDLENISRRLGNIHGCRYIGLELISAGNSTADKRKLQRQLYEAALDFLGKERGWHCIMSVTQSQNCNDVGLLYCDELSDSCGIDEHTFLEKLRTYMIAAIPVQVQYFVGCKVEGIENLAESYRTAMVAKSCQAFQFGCASKDAVWYEEEVRTRSGAFLEKDLLDNLVQTVVENEPERIAEGVHALYQILNQMHMDERIIDLDLNYLLFQMVYLASQQDSEIDQEEALRYITENAFDQGMMRGSESHFCQFAIEYADYLAALRGRHPKGIIEQIEKDMQGHYAEDISLKMLSDKYYLNSAYLGQLFKKQVGKTFKAYLTELRMEGASNLLLQTDEKVYTIAEKVGYHDLDYFVNRFVTAKGCTPAKYRRQADGKIESSG